MRKFHKNEAETRLQREPETSQTFPKIWTTIRDVVQPFFCRQKHLHNYIDWVIIKAPTKVKLKIKWDFNGKEQE